MYCSEKYLTGHDHPLIPHTISLALSGFSRYFECAVEGVFVARFWFTATAVVNLGAGPQTGNVSVNHWYVPPASLFRASIKKDS